MSTVMRPRGRLPRRIYWVRRALLAVVALTVLGFVWWLLPSGGSTGEQTADLGAGTGAGTPTGTHPTSPTHGAPTTPAPRTTAPPTSPTRTTSLPTRPTGTCSPTVVRIMVAADSAPPGAGTTVRYRMWTSDGSTCRLGITPALMETKIYSDADLAWQSSSCPDELAAKNVVVSPQPTLLYTFRWDGMMREGACSSTGTAAPPAQYRVAASLIGGEPSESSFFVTEPDLGLR